MVANRRKRPGEVRVGLSGWMYKSWRGRFYPKGLPHKRELAHLATIFRTVEINGTFYSMQRPDSFGRWDELTPDDFVFAVKGPRFLTHMKRLNDPVAPLGNFIASGVLRLDHKLGPILWQLPPNFRFDRDKLDAFFRLLPRDTKAAAACGRRHDHRLKARAWLRAGPRPHRLRHALEVRHESFRDPAFIELLRKHDVALVCADTVEWPLLMDLTADFVYCRLHGSRELYRSGYSATELARWARRIRAWRDGKPMRDGTFAGSPARAMPRDVYVYFDNTDKLMAPRDAQALMRRLEEA
jgi:uncharacterized protein YecE (DUF72 family)